MLMGGGTRRKHRRYSGYVGSRKQMEILSFSEVSKSSLTLRFAHTRMQSVPGTFLSMVKSPGHKRCHSPQFTVKIKSEWISTFTPPYTFVETLPLVLG